MKHTTTTIHRHVFEADFGFKFDDTKISEFYDLFVVDCNIRFQNNNTIIKIDEFDNDYISDIPVESLKDCMVDLMLKIKNNSNFKNIIELEDEMIVQVNVDMVKSYMVKDEAKKLLKNIEGKLIKLTRTKINSSRVVDGKIMIKDIGTYNKKFFLEVL